MNLLVSPSPHIHSKESTTTLMLDVIIALLPAVLISFVFYGLSAICIQAISIITCVLLEYLVTKYLLKQPNTICDLSAVVTGILLAMNLPCSTPLWVVVLGAIFAIGVTKLSFGGIGQNIFNPAIAGRVFLLVSFPTYMTDWKFPTNLFGLKNSVITLFGHDFNISLGNAVNHGANSIIDAVSGPTPLGAIKEGLLSGATVPELMTQHGYHYSDMIFSNIGGSAGELSAIALLLGFIYLVFKKVIKPYTTISIFVTVALVSLIFWGLNPERFTDPIFNLLTGGMILGACFMATDYVTSPMSIKGGIVFGIGIGFITLMIRYFGAYPEGMSFAILIMNATVPLLNRWFRQRKYGRK